MGEIEVISVVRDSTETVPTGVTVVLKVDKASGVVCVNMAVCVVAAVRDSPMEVETLYVSVVVSEKEDSTILHNDFVFIVVEVVFPASVILVLIRDVVEEDADGRAVSVTREVPTDLVEVLVESEETEVVKVD